MDLNLLKYFQKVHQTGSITAAAEALNLSQPAVSSAIRRLENELGYALITRSGRGISFTSAATTLVKSIEKPLLDLESSTGRRKFFQIFATESVAYDLAILDDCICREMPLDEESGYQDLLDQKVDLLFSITGIKHPSLVSTPVGKIKIVCVSSSNHPRINNNLTYEDYFTENHVTLSARINNLYTLNHVARVPLRERRIKMESNSIRGMLHIASRSDLIAHSTLLLAKELQGSLQYNIHDIPFDIDHLELSMVYHRRDKDDKWHQFQRERAYSHLRSKLMGIASG